MMNRKQLETNICEINKSARHFGTLVYMLFLIWLNSNATASSYVQGEMQVLADAMFQLNESVTLLLSS